jgi:hypothetical protein
MTDVGIDHLIPQYPASYLTSADTAYWEAVYTDGTLVRETDGTKYDDIDRSRLHSFRIVHHGEIMVQVFPPAGATGHNLVYRRRTVLGMMGVGRAVWFILGFAPMGPVHALNLDDMKMTTAPHFGVGGMFDAPQPLPGEPEDMLGLS